MFDAKQKNREKTTHFHCDVQASRIATRSVPNPQFHQGQTHHIGLLGEDVVANGDHILEILEIA